MHTIFTMLLLLNLFFIEATLRSQNKAYEAHTIAFYNVENLVDTINDPNTLDEYSPLLELNVDRAAIYTKRIGQIASVIADIGYDTTTNSPVIIGLAEVENKGVLDDLANAPALINKDYGRIHFDSPDVRGIDVALLYQKALFKPLNFKPYFLNLKDNSNKKSVFTRDILVVSGHLSSELLHIIICHWPSRRGGEKASAYRRLKAAHLTKHIVDSINTKQPDAKIIVMGDFNDNPTNKSIKTILKTKDNPNQLKPGDLYNPVQAIYKKGFGTNAYRDKWSMFNQILLSSSLVSKNYTTLNLLKTRIYNKSYLITPEGRYKGYPFRSFSYQGFTGGYSDHFPVYAVIIKGVK